MSNIFNTIFLFGGCLISYVHICFQISKRGYVGD